MLKLPEDSKRGVRVDQILDIPDTQALIKPNDVIMQVGDYPVDDDGTITYDGNTVGVSAAVDLAQNGDTIPLKIWRDGQMIDVKLPVKVYNDDDAQGNQYDVLPPYYIYGGLVFTPLSLDYLKTFGQDWSDSAGRELIYELVYRHLEDPKHWRPSRSCSPPSSTTRSTPTSPRAARPWSIKSTACASSGSATCPRPSPPPPAPTPSSNSCPITTSKSSARTTRKKPTRIS
jgi:hypothetical protein